MIPGFGGRRRFSDLSEQEILALAISNSTGRVIKCTSTGTSKIPKPAIKLANPATGVRLARVIIGKATEWGGKNTQTVANPITRCYTRGGIERLFADFEGLSMRKAFLRAPLDFSRVSSTHEHSGWATPHTTTRGGT